ncbi:HIT domain-containing protein [Plantibacter sp. PA-3-X8]|uniref:HIT family protein n=1 Tax=unclassified Plantibacter TaxID=2624265 RepID=UPI000F5DD596|nr:MULTISPECIES: HIT domain-containing protein [unclassified Plantibacter]AZH83545.1 HIT domain-containing protein [Plantibacter sp. PA-3-X8]
MARGPVEDGCRFCELPDQDRVLQLDDSFAIMFSLGPLIPGHFMLVARDHYPSSAELPPSQIPKTSRVIRRILDELSDRFGEFTAFEHGRAGACVPPGHGEDHCYHAHVHFLPKNVDLAASVRDDYELISFDSWASFQAQHSEHPVPYIAVWEGAAVHAVFDPSNLPHHYLRTKVATTLGEPLLGDWVAFPRSWDIDTAKASHVFEFLRKVDLT